MPANYVLLERIELNASAANITFANIPQSGYTDLKIVASTRNDYNGTYVSGKLYFNGGGAGTYLSRNIDGEDGGVYTNGYSNTQAEWGPDAANQHTANMFTSMEFYFPNYTSNAEKSWNIEGVAEQNGSTMYALQLWAGSWNQTAAITSITVSNSTANFMQYSTFSLYGLAAVGTTPAIAPKALGGNITTDGTYWYHTFLTSGVFIPASSLSCDALVVAGGGGGYFSGAGAGGLLAYTSQSFTLGTNYSVNVGAGGSAGSNSLGFAGQGNNSTILGLTASLGGGRGVGGGTAGVGGGSGGGSTINTAGSYGAGTSGQGNNGGTGNWGTPSYTGGGGGGAGAVGASVPSSGDDNGGNGGAGLNTYSSWASATGTGASGYYAGGGGGGKSSGGAGGTGGAGGGGNGSTGGTGSAATVNTGGGGGGGNGAGGAGGSGIVIIRYAV